MVQVATKPHWQKGKPGQKAFRPYGSALDILLNKDDVVGTDGPAGTGKSRACLEKLHIIAEKYPRVRILIARKTRESLSEAALFTYEERVLPEGHPVDASNIRRSHRQQYHYPNGSLIVVCGLDKPQKIMSTEYDIIYVQEAIECDEADFEMLSTRLRNGVLPYQQLIFDCNPDTPKHWIKAGEAAGRWKLIHSRHEDNPTLWEEAPQEQQPLGPNAQWPDVGDGGRVGKWTEGGVKYIQRLEALTGPRYYRLRKGLWVGAEGAVYEEFDTQQHVWFDGDGKAPWGNDPRPPKSWRRVWVVDFGYTHPMVIQKWAIDPDGGMWMYEEIYHTQMLVEDATKLALETSGWSYDPDNGLGHVPIEPFPDPLPETIIADHDAENRATMEKNVGMFTTAAIKNISGGIQAVQKRLRARVPVEGKKDKFRPRIMYRGNSVVKKDEELEEAKLPTSTIDEYAGYVWDTSNNKKKGELPVDKDNHGLDGSRYLVAHEDGILDHEPKAKEVTQAAATSVQNIVRSVPRRGAANNRGRRSGSSGGTRSGRRASRVTVGENWEQNTSWQSTPTSGSL